MQITALHQYTPQEAREYIQTVAFFKALLQANKSQHDMLLRLTQVLTLAPEEVLIHKGTTDKVFYSVVRGKLDVYAEQVANHTPIGHVSAGQVVGGLSLISQKPRTATLTASRHSGAILLATDFSLFGEIDDFQHVDINTKLCLFRNVVNFTSWKLDQYRHQTQDQRLTDQLSKLDVYDGKKDTLEELIYLEKQGLELGRLLCQWNNAI